MSWTSLFRREQQRTGTRNQEPARRPHLDRWSTASERTGIESVSTSLTPEQLREHEIFAHYDDAFLKKISPHISVAVWKSGSVLFEEGTYIDLAFYIEVGQVGVSVLRAGDVESANQSQATRSGGPAAKGDDRNITYLASMDFDLQRGALATLPRTNIFGEIGATGGWPQSITAQCLERCTLVQIRLPALREMREHSSTFKDWVDDAYRRRSLRAQLKTTPLFRGCDDDFIKRLSKTVDLVSLKPGETIARQGEVAGALYLVRSGFVKLSERIGEGDVVVTYLSKGMTLGEVELLIEDSPTWQATATSVEYADLVRISEADFRSTLKAVPDIEEQLWQAVVERIKDQGTGRREVDKAEFTEVALDMGLVQGNSMLVIDLDLCTRCDDCVRACAATHGGRPRFVREGNRYDNLLVTKSCLHCRDPVCLVGCPTGAIHRAGTRSVVEIDENLCIGCSNCANNCPYDSIVMQSTGSVWPQGDDTVPPWLQGLERDVASKCDLCESTGHGPACVANCPQGCAVRVGSLDEIRDLLGEPGGGT